MSETLKNTSEKLGPKGDDETKFPPFDPQKAKKAKQERITKSLDAVEGVDEAHLLEVQNAANAVQAVFNDRGEKAQLMMSAEQSKIETTPSHHPIEYPSLVQKLSKMYDSKERPRIERIKAELSLPATEFRRLHNIMEHFFTPASYYQLRQANVGPTMFTKIIRLAGDKLGIKPKRDEESREKEAIRIALAEYEKEKRQLQQKAREKAKEEAKKRSEEAKKRSEEAKKRSEEAKKRKLLNEMGAGHAARQRWKKEVLRNQRSQEIIERSLNSQLLKIDNLEMEVLSGNPGVSKESEKYEYDGVKIPVYTLKGLPYSILSTSIDYRKTNKNARENLISVGDESLIGNETYQEVLENPAKWVERRDIAEQSSGFGTRGENALADTICCSYHNSETNNLAYVYDGKKDTGVNDSSHDLIYGFENVEGDSIIKIDHQDGGSGNAIGKYNTAVDEHKLDILEDLQYNACNYNEVTLRRYSENGYPKRPDYILANNGRITDAALRHAKYFGIPIVNIDMPVYIEKQIKRGREIMNSINKNEEYLSVYAKMATVHSLMSFRNNFDVQVVNNARVINSRSIQPQYIDAAKIEFEKRIDYINDTLGNIVNMASLNREEVLSKISDEFKNLHLSFYDASQQSVETSNGTITRGNKGPECRIDIEFTPKHGYVKIETSLFEQKDSKYYHVLEPLIRKYLEVTR